MLHVSSNIAIKLTGVLCRCGPSIIRFSFEQAVQLEELTLVIGAPEKKKQKQYQGRVVLDSLVVSQI